MLAFSFIAGNLTNSSTFSDYILSDNSDLMAAHRLAGQDEKMGPGKKSCLASIELFAVFA